MPVYFIQNEFGDVKIGFSKEPIKRLSELQSATPGDLELIRVIDGGRPTEKWLHDRFSDLHINREWYRFDPDMMTACPPEERRANGAIECHADIVSLWPTITAFADETGLKRPTAAAFKMRNSIPSWYWPRVVAAAEKRGFAVVTFTKLAATQKPHAVVSVPAPPDDAETE